MLDFKYKIFMVVARLLSFSRAAKEMGLTQPAISFQVKQLEEEVGSRLFLRQKNRIELTPTGEMLFKEMLPIEAQTSKASERIMRRLGKLKGMVQIGVSTTISNYFLPPVLAEFNSLHPDVGMKVMVGNTVDTLVNLNEGIIDFAIIEGEVSHRQLEIEVLFEDEMVIIAKPNFDGISGGIISKSCLAELPFITREHGSGTRAAIDSIKDGRKPIIKPANVVLELGSSAGIKRVVAAGLGVSMVSMMTLEREVELNLLSIAHIEAHPVKRNICFVFNRGAERNELVNEMVRLCKSRASKIISHGTKRA